ncbi:Sodium/potassium-transporting ATPase subunit beta [Taenia solium]|eukprot:TsM_000397100 transcript=TsM_000397100 gene=TsM_000397100
MDQCGNRTRPLLSQFLDVLNPAMKKFREIKATSAQRLRSLGLFILNPEKGTFLNRTLSSWAKIFIYYVIFYTCLFGFLVGMIFFVTNVVVDERVPSLTGRQSLLGLSPGLTFLPFVEAKGKLHPYPLYDSNNKAKYVELMRKYVSGYRAMPKNCDFLMGTRLLGNLYDACQFPLRLLGPCEIRSNSSQEFCIFLKMNKVFGYLPDVSGNKIFVSCQATDGSKDRELGPATFYPPASDRNQTVGYFSTVSFPYLNQAGYQSPLLAVTFPRIAKNVSITVGCKYLNINIEDEYKFELIVHGSL